MFPWGKSFIKFISTRFTSSFSSDTMSLLNVDLTLIATAPKKKKKNGEERAGKKGGERKRRQPLKKKLIRWRKCLFLFFSIIKKKNEKKQQIEALVDRNWLFGFWYSLHEGIEGIDNLERVFWIDSITNGGEHYYWVKQSVMLLLLSLVSK